MLSPCRRRRAGEHRTKPKITPHDSHTHIGSAPFVAAGERADRGPGFASPWAGPPPITSNVPWSLPAHGTGGGS